MTIEEEYYSPEYYHPMGEDVGFYRFVYYSEGSRLGLQTRLTTRDEWTLAETLDLTIVGQLVLRMLGEIEAYKTALFSDDDDRPAMLHPRTGKQVRARVTFDEV